MSRAHKNIWLRYSATPLTSLTLDTEAANQRSFATIKVTDRVPNVTLAEGVLLNGRKYSHKLYSHLECEVIISADEFYIDGTWNGLNFFRDFWNAQYKYIANAFGSDTDYKEVQTGGGKMPITYVDDIRMMREISFICSFTNPM